jgi:2-iminobutanoate/2-iminopropanoate deaminase
MPIQKIPHNPSDGVYAPVAAYAHALELRDAGRLLFVTGTIGLDPEGVAGATLDDQLRLIWANIRTILASAGMTVDDIVRVTSYLRDASYAQANGEARHRELGGRLVPTTAVVAQTLMEDWMVEVEVIAAA